MVQTDLQAAYDGDPAATGMDEVIFSYPVCTPSACTGWPMSCSGWGSP